MARITERAILEPCSGVIFARGTLLRLLAQSYDADLCQLVYLLICTCIHLLVLYTKNNNPHFRMNTSENTLTTKRNTWCD